MNLFLRYVLLLLKNKIHQQKTEQPTTNKSHFIYLCMKRVKKWIEKVECVPHTHTHIRLHHILFFTSLIFWILLFWTFNNNKIRLTVHNVHIVFAILFSLTLTHSWWDGSFCHLLLRHHLSPFFRKPKLKI